MTDPAYSWRGAGRVQDIDEVRERVRVAFNLWRGGDYLHSKCHAAQYLAARGIGWLATKRFRDTIRWRPDAWHPSGRQLPALYCAVTDVHGAFRAVHRVYLQSD